MGFLRHQRVLPNERKAVAYGSPFIGIKPCRLFLEELLPSRDPLRFIDDAKVQTVSLLTKSHMKFDHYFCPLANKSSEKPLILSITPPFHILWYTFCEIVNHLYISSIRGRPSPLRRGCTSGRAAYQYPLSVPTSRYHLPKQCPWQIFLLCEMMS